MEEQQTKPGKQAPAPKKPVKPTPQQLEKGQRLKYFVDAEKVPRRPLEEIDAELEKELAPPTKKRVSPSKGKEKTEPNTAPRERPSERKIQAGARGEKNPKDLKVVGTNSKYGPVMRGKRGGTFVIINGVRYYGKYKLERARAKS